MNAKEEKLHEMGNGLAAGEVVNYEATSNNAQVAVVPKDRYFIVGTTMYLFGITSLLPWNFFIQANDYWMFKFRNVSADFDPSSQENKTDMQAIFSSYLAISSKVPYVLFLLVNTYVSTKIAPSKRIQWPLLAMILMFIFTTLVVFVNTDYNQRTFLGVTLTTVVAINAMCGFVQGGGTGIAGCLPKRFMSYNVNGMALGGLLASAAQILSLVGDTSPTQSAFFYFTTATAFLIVTFIYLKLTLKSELFHFYMSKQTSMLTRNVPRCDRTEVSNWEIFKQMWVYAVSIVLVFWVSLSVLPAVVVLVSSTSNVNNIWTGRLFTPVACFLVFNIADFVSRLAAFRLAIPSRFRYVTLLLTLSRVAFVPLLMLCNAHPRRHLPVLLDSDAAFVSVVAALGLTNGYCTTVLLTQAPKQVKSGHQEAAGAQLALFLGLGLMLGSVTSYGLVVLL